MKKNRNKEQKKFKENLILEETADSVDQDMEVIDLSNSGRKNSRGSRHGKKRNRNATIALAASAAALLLFYAGMGMFFESHFFPGTRMEDLNCSMKTAVQAQDIISKEAGSYRLVIEGREGLSETVTTEEIGLAPLFDSSLSDSIERQNGFLWPVYLFKENKIDIPVEMQYSQEELRKRFEKFSFFEPSAVREPQNAYIGEYADHAFPVVPQDEGTLLDQELTYAKITEAIDNLSEHLSLEEEGCYVRPEITQDSPELKERLEALNRYVGSVITYQFGEDTEVVDGDLIRQWLKTDNGTTDIDPELVREYVNGLARKYDTFGKDRQFRTTPGETITVQHGNYGWWMDRAAETEGLIEAVKAGQQTVREPVYRAKAAQYGEDDIGGTYVEIDLTNQHLYLYVDGQMKLETDFVSGNIFKGNATPPGVFAITYKERDATLNGENYSSPVDYWMPFNGNVGMHDARWRNTFGGDIYLTNGSHGCVNLPHEKAKQIYEYVEKGTPVIVYGGYQGPSKEEQEQMILQQQIDALLQQQAILNGQLPPVDGAAPGAVPEAQGAVPGEGGQETQSPSPDGTAQPTDGGALPVPGTETPPQETEGEAQ